MPNLSFKVIVNVDNPGTLEEVQSRVADLSPAFQAIFVEWVKTNEQKFELSQGSELGGAEIFGEHWEGVTPQYYKQKRREGFTDWLMVKSGDLKAALTDPDMLFQDIGADSATFGQPNDSFLADLVQWQASPRQKNRFVIYLGMPDMNAIQEIMQDYLGLGGDFKEFRSDKALAAVALRDEIGSMDAEFNFAAGGE